MVGLHPVQSFIEFRQVLKSNELVAVKFTASWCGKLADSFSMVVLVASLRRLASSNKDLVG
jgi:hypothetical protein